MASSDASQHQFIRDRAPFGDFRQVSPYPTGLVGRSGIGPLGGDRRGCSSGLRSHGITRPPAPGRSCRYPSSAVAAQAFGLGALQ